MKIAWIIFITVFSFFYSWMLLFTYANTGKHPDVIHRLLCKKERQVYKCWLLLDHFKNEYPNIITQKFYDKCVSEFTSGTTTEPEDTYVWFVCYLAQIFYEKFQDSNEGFNDDGVNIIGKEWICIFNYCEKLLPEIGYEYWENHQWNAFTMDDVKENQEKLHQLIVRRFGEWESHAEERKKLHDIWCGCPH